MATPWAAIDVVPSSDATTMRGTSAVDPVRVWAALAVIGACVLRLQYVTLPKLQDVVVSSAGTSRLENVRSSALQLVLDKLASVVGPIDVVVVALMAATVAALVVGEARHGTLSKFCVRLDTHTTELVGFLLFCSILATRYYWNSGDVFMSDSESLGVRAWMVSEHLRHLQWPVWSNYWYMGFPLMHYYGPLYFVVVGLITVIIGNIHTATKLVLWTAHVGSIFAMFVFLRTATRDLYGALIGALAYGIVFYRIGMILYSGDLNLNVIWLLYPLLFLAVEMYLSQPLRVRRHFLLFSAITAGLILTHHAYAFFGLVFAGAYIAVRIATWDADASAKIQALRFFTLASVAGFLMGAFSLLPFVLEMQDVRGMPNIPFDRLLPSFRSYHWLAMMVRWAPLPAHSSTEAYVGASIVALSALSAILILRTRSSVGLGLLVCAVYSFATVRSGTQYGLKNMNFVIFFLAALTSFAPRAVRLLLAGTAAHERLQRKWGHHLDARLAVMLSGLILVDLGPLTFQDTFINGFYDTGDAGYAAALHIDKSYRVLERRLVQYDPSKGLAQNFEPDRLGIVSPYLPIQSPLGRMNEESARSISYNAEMIKRVQLDLNQGRISDLSLKGLLLMNVRFLVFRDRTHFFAPPLEPTTNYSINGLTLDLTHTRPLLVSTRAIRVEDMRSDESGNPIEERRYWDRDMLDYKHSAYDTVVKPLIETMNIDLNRGTADYLVTRGSGPLPALPANPRQLAVDVKSFDVTIDTAQIRYSASDNAYARLPFSYFPYLDVRVDGSAAPFFRSAMHCIVMALPAGEHVISVRGQASPLRKRAFFFSMIATALILSWPSRSLERMVRGPGSR